MTDPTGKWTLSYNAALQGRKIGPRSKTSNGKPAPETAPKLSLRKLHSPLGRAGLVDGLRLWGSTTEGVD